MQVITVVLALATVAIAAPQYNQVNTGAERDAVILRSDNDNIGVGGYRFAYETSNGIAHEEQGQLVNGGSDGEYNTVQGRYSYTGPDGVVYTVVYTADPDGFHPQGDHIPTR